MSGRANTASKSSSSPGPSAWVQRDQAGKPKLDAQGNRTYRAEPLDRPVWRTFTVFNAEQTAGLELDRATPNRPAWHPHRVAEAVLEASGVPIRHTAGDRAYYHLERDHIVLPQRAQFPSADHYYQTALHELGHSTGHPDRMKRETLIEGVKTGFGSPAYAKEELRAEISAMMTGDRLGTGHDPARGAAYVEGWIQGPTANADARPGTWACPFGTMAACSIPMHNWSTRPATAETPAA